jgi:hypothetical protein
MLANKYASKLATKRWRAYLKQENHNHKILEGKSKYFVVIIILSLIKFILRIVENVQTKRKYMVEKVSVE